MKQLRSVLTDDMEHCYITGAPNPHIHHIFYSAYRKQSELYGFVVPLRHDLHIYGPDSVHMNPNRGLDLHLKQLAQAYYEEHFGSRESFREIFGRSWL